MSSIVWADLISIAALFSVLACSFHFYARYREVTKASVRDDLESLERVHQLRGDGRITEEEFASLRAKLIGKIRQRI